MPEKKKAFSWDDRCICGHTRRDHHFGNGIDDCDCTGCDICGGLDCSEFTLDPTSPTTEANA